MYIERICALLTYGDAEQGCCREVLKDSGTAGLEQFFRKLTCHIINKIICAACTFEQPVKPLDGKI